MASLYVSEYRDVQSVGGGSAQVPTGWIRDQKVAIGGVSTQSLAFDGATRCIRIHTDAICSYVVGANPTATDSNARLAADQENYIGVQGDQKIAVIANV